MSMTSSLGPIAPIKSYCRLTRERAARAYRMNSFFSSLAKPEQAEWFRQDAAACMSAFGLTEHEQWMLNQRDYERLLDYGVSLVALAKALRIFGMSLIDFGAACRGQSAAEFVQQRRQANQGQPWEF